MNLLAKITKRRPHIRLNAAGIGPWLTIIAANGEPLLHSEAYESTAGARRAADRLAADTGWVVKEVRS